MESLDGIGIFRVTRTARLEQAVDSVSVAVAEARAAGLDRLMVVVPDAGLDKPSPAEHVAMVRAWAGLAGGRLRLAFVSPAALLDPQRLGVVAARGFGLVGETFLSEDEALAWLREDF